MVKYRCVKADKYGGVYWEGRQYIEEGIQDARKRAMKMIHGDKNDSVLIWLESDFKKRPWIGYRDKVYYEKGMYVTTYKHNLVALNRDGTLNPDKLRY